MDMRTEDTDEGTLASDAHKEVQHTELSWAQGIYGWKLVELLVVAESQVFFLMFGSVVELMVVVSAC